jgi:hypothetical protein
MENISKRTYQGFSNYDGTLAGGKENSYVDTLYGNPTYRGIEYDWEVPDDMVVGSPGGVSSIQHHYTHGFYGRGNTSSDIYAGQGQRYNSGLYGNMYQTGQSGGQGMGYYPDAPDYQYWQNYEPSQFDYTNSTANEYTPFMTDYGNPGSFQNPPPPQNSNYKILSKPGNENYEKKSSPGKAAAAIDTETFLNDSFEILESAYTTPGITPASIEPLEAMQNPSPSGGTGGTLAAGEKDLTTFCIGSNINPWIFLLVVLFSAIVLAFWVNGTLLLVKQEVHQGKEPAWFHIILYAISFSFIFLLMLWFFGVPLTNVK